MKYKLPSTKQGLLVYLETLKEKEKYYMELRRNMKSYGITVDGQQIKDYALNSIIDKMGKNIAMCRQEMEWAKWKLDLMNGVELITNKQNQGKAGNR